MDLIACYVKVCNIVVHTHVLVPGIMRGILDVDSHAHSV
jgi:hypothetical protein